jgi:hypothetical protein
MNNRDPGLDARKTCTRRHSHVGNGNRRTGTTQNQFKSQSFHDLTGLPAAQSTAPRSEGNAGDDQFRCWLDKHADRESPSTVLLKVL